MVRGKRLKGMAAGALASALAASALAAGKPNILVIMMDDFGVGQFAPLAQGLTTGSFDPAFVEYVAGIKDGTYPGDLALAVARQAMPTMDRLAANGLLFTRAFSSSALCAPSRCGLATAIEPNRLGIYENADVNVAPGALPPDRILAPRFRAAGYATGHVGKWHLGPLDEAVARAVIEKHGLPPGTNVNKLKKSEAVYREIEAAGYYGSVPAALHPLNNGFDYYYGYNYHQSKFYGDSNVWDGFAPAGRQEGYNTETFTEKALAFIDSAAATKKPFFLNLNYHAVHGPLFPNPPERYMERFAGAPELLKNFYGHVFAVDEGIRRIVEALAAKGMLANTIIVFTADNGGSVQRESPLPGNAPHRGHKGQYTQGGIRVPLVIHWPDRIRQGRTTDALVWLLDILPTAMDSAGIEAPGGLDGKSLLPLIDGAPKGPHENLAWCGLESRSWGFLRELGDNLEGRRSREPGSWTVVTDDWLLRFTGTVEEKLYNDFPDGRAPQLELYDMRRDPGEARNVVGEHPETVAALKAIAAKRMAQLPPPAHWSRKNWTELKTSLER